MMRCVLSLLFAMGIGTIGASIMGIAAIDAAYAAVPPANPPPPPASPPVTSTEGFLAAVASGTRFEIDSSKLALERSRSPAIKEFAYRMGADYGAAAARFKDAVARAQLALPPDALDARHQAMLDDLKARDAQSFDKAYLADEVQVLREMADLFRTYATMGDNARIKRFSQELLLSVRSHFDDVSKLH